MSNDNETYLMKKESERLMREAPGMEDNTIQMLRAEGVNRRQPPDMAKVTIGLYQYSLCLGTLGKYVRDFCYELVEGQMTASNDLPCARDEFKEVAKSEAKRRSEEEKNKWI